MRKILTEKLKEKAKSKRDFAKELEMKNAAWLEGYKAGQASVLKSLEITLNESLSRFLKKK